MNTISDSTKNAILLKTPYAHSANPAGEGLNESQIKGLFYKALTDPSDSIVSEINRIVTEGNEQFAELSTGFNIGTIEICPLEGVKAQTIIPCGSLLRVSGEVQSYTTAELETAPLSSFGFSEEGKYLFIKIKAPEGVIPDSTISMQCGQHIRNGLTILDNTQEEALDGNYYLYHGIEVGTNSSFLITMVWNSSCRGRVLIDVSDNFLYETNKRLFIRYSAYPAGGYMSIDWSSTKTYIGFMIGKTPSLNATDYSWARFIPDIHQSSQKNITLTVAGWNNNRRQTVSVVGLLTSDSVVVSPAPLNIGEWSRKGVYCLSQQNDSLTFACEEKPTTSIYVNLLVGA